PCGFGPTLSPIACVPGVSPTTLAVSPVALTGPSTDGMPFASSLQRVPFVLPTPQAASLPLGHSWG
ncbi:hypothetical protein FD755_001884, partial [Muntiacus reevesi]